MSERVKVIEQTSIALFERDVNDAMQLGYRLSSSYVTSNIRKGSDGEPYMIFYYSAILYMPGKIFVESESGVKL